MEENRPRRFQFRLRTLLIVVTLFALPLGYVGWQAKIVRERTAWLRTHQWQEGDYSRLPFVRRWLGDFPVEILWISTPPNDSERQMAISLFPEAIVEEPIDTIKRDLGENYRPAD
jgi:hypothetical protein